MGLGPTGTRPYRSLGPRTLPATAPIDRACLAWHVDEERTALKILSAMELTRDQVAALMHGESTWEVTAADLVENPYYAANCTHRSRFPIALAILDQACFPAGHVQWTNLIEPLIGLRNPRR